MFSKISLTYQKQYRHYSVEIDVDNASESTEFMQCMCVINRYSILMQSALTHTHARAARERLDAWSSVKHQLFVLLCILAEARGSRTEPYTQFPECFARP